MKGFVFNDYGRHPSTLQAIGSGNSGHPVKDEDIVYSAWKHAAVRRLNLYDIILNTNQEILLCSMSYTN